jgi:tRNA 2-thiouridine synthesizing protein A
MTQKTILDASGLLCPEPVMLLHKAVRNMADGDMIEVVATDPSTTRDIPKFCHFLGYVLVDHREEGNSYYYLIQKSETTT